MSLLRCLSFFRNQIRLIIVGFNLNTDDNHINGIIRSYLNSKEVIYLDYDDTGSKERICYRLRLKDSTNLKYFKINQDNAVLIFEELLKQ